MKKKYIFVLIFICLLIGIFLVLKQIPTLQNDKKDDKVSEEVSDDIKSGETDKPEGTEDEEDIEIPLENGVEDDQSQMDLSENDGDNHDGDVELPAVPIQ